MKACFLAAVLVLAATAVGAQIIERHAPLVFKDESYGVPITIYGLGDRQERIEFNWPAVERCAQLPMPDEDEWARNRNVAFHAVTTVRYCRAALTARDQLCGEEGEPADKARIRDDAGRFVWRRVEDVAAQVMPSHVELMEAEGLYGVINHQSLRWHTIQMYRIVLAARRRCENS